jgi:putative ABC transport system permease protein
VHWLRRIFHKQQSEKLLDAELRFHLERQISDYIAAGLPPEEARRRAHLDFGGLESIKQQTREARRGNFIEILRQDVRYGFRMLGKNPGFTTVAVLTLALGIGGTTAIFSVVSSALLRPLPYHDPSQLVWVADENPRAHMTVVLESDYFAYQQLKGIFQDVAAYEPGETHTLTGFGDAVRLNGGAVTYNFFDVLGVLPQMGRSFLPEEDRAGVAHTVLLTDTCWRQHFSSDANIIGRSIALDNESYSVIGVLPPQFEFLDNPRVAVIVPLALQNREISITKPMRLVRAVGRLRQGITPAAAAANVDAANQRIWAGYPPSWAGMMEGTRAQVLPLREHLVGKAQPALLVLLAAVASVLLIACLNIANLQLARGVSREKEIAIRGALGAGRSRLLRQLLTENLIISLAGGASGLAIAAWLVRVLRASGPANIPHLATSQLNLPVFAFALIVSLATGILFGLAPMLAASRVPILETIKESGTPTGPSWKIGRSHNLLTVIELAAALVLFIGAGLLVRSFAQLTSVPPGFDARGVLTAQISLPINLYKTQEQQLAFFRSLEKRLISLPGVESAALANVLPLQGFNLGSWVQREELPPAPPGTSPTTGVGVVTPGYFSVLHISLVQGRLLDSRDGRVSPNDLVVNEAFIRRYFPNENALGKRLKVADQGIWTIVGVVRDSKQRGLAADIEPEIFIPVEKWCPPELTVLLRLQRDPITFLPSVRAVVSQLDKNLPLFDVQTMDSLLNGELAAQRFNAALLGAFAIFAVFLAAIGIYGVMAYSVHQRVREVAIRMALGAEPRDVLWMTLSRGLVLAATGLVFGLAGAFALTRLLGTLLYRVRPSDPATFVGVTLALLAVALAACWIPARRAMRVDPMVALRYE